ncbi:MAG: RNA methyltransferase [Candidatus Latescibacteria bacterium]|nr:RNA methyltransferase [Candidatus Latescibacterota bacterium]
MNRKIVTITSESNKTFREFRSLLGKRGIKRHGKTLVAGARIIADLARLRPDIIRGWIVASADHRQPPGMSCSVPVYQLGWDLFRILDVNGTNYPILLVDVPELPGFDEEKVREKAILAIPFQDPTNVGAAIRSAAAFGIRTVILLKESANPFHQKSIRAAGPALFTIGLTTGPSIRDLSFSSYEIVALDKDGEDIGSFRFPERFVLVPGLEGSGLPDLFRSRHRVSIPISPAVESLNASVAASIALYCWKKPADKLHRDMPLFHL